MPYGFRPCLYSMHHASSQLYEHTIGILNAVHLVLAGKAQLAHRVSNPLQSLAGGLLGGCCCHPGCT